MGSYKIVNNQRTVIIYSQGLTTSLDYSGSGELNLYKSHMKYNENYCEFLGKMREDIYEQFGKSPYSDIDKQIMYLLSDGDFEYFFLILTHGQILSKLFLLWQKNHHHLQMQRRMNILILHIMFMKKYSR